LCFDDRRFHNERWYSGSYALGQWSATVTAEASQSAVRENRKPLELPRQTPRLAFPTLKRARVDDKSLNSVSLLDQALIQVFHAAAAGPEPKKSYFIGMSSRVDGHRPIQLLANFVTDQASSIIVNAAGPIRRPVQSESKEERRYLVISESTTAEPNAIVQLEAPYARKAACPADTATPLNGCIEA
jgi:hypothetical protein